VTALNLSLLTAYTPATSGSYTFSVTQSQIIRQAMLDIGALAEGEVPTAQEYSDCSFKLNLMVKQWMGNTDFAPGLKVWTRKRADLFLGNMQYTYALGQTGDNWAESTSGLQYPVSYGQTQLSNSVGPGSTVLPVLAAGQFNILDYIGIQVGSDIFWTRVAAVNAGGLTVTIPGPGIPASTSAIQNAYVWNYTKKGIRPITIITCVLRDIYANDTPIDFMTVERYESLPTKTANTNIADPTAILYESQFKTQYPNGRLYLDVGGAQDVTKHLHCVYLSPTQDFVNPGDAPDYPQEWYRPLVLGHAKDICGMFDCAWEQDMQDNLTEALAIAKQTDPATTDIYFEVDSSSPYGP
jgi:hypothetical protein